MSEPLNIMIIGAGTGGLCLAHGLRADGIAAEVFERDRSSEDQQPGYRLSISATGSSALRDCLPAALYRKLVARSADPSTGVTFLDHQLNELLRINFQHVDRQDQDAERPVSRTTLRRILLEGLDESVRFGKKFQSFEDGPGGTVVAHFADGSSASGTLLVGADGASSHVRSLLLPQARRIETDIVAVGGKVPLSEATRTSVPEPILAGPTPLGPRGCFMFASAVQYRGNPDLMITPVDEREEYVMWGFSARRHKFGRTELQGLEPDDLKSIVLALMSDWHESLRGLVQAAAPASVSAFLVKTSVPIDPWPTRNVTLLGDALHNMTPFRGVGANTALRDAAALHRSLVAVNRGEAELLLALAAYETRHGRLWVRRSAHLTRRHGAISRGRAAFTHDHQSNVSARQSHSSLAGHVPRRTIMAAPEVRTSRHVHCA